MIEVNNGSTYTMTNSKISGNTGENGGAVYVGANSTFAMVGGTIENCTATKGGAVYVAAGGTFTMTGGVISDSNAVNGAAVYVADGGKFAMTGGTISGGTASQNGGAIYVAKGGTAYINDRTISGCSAENGGAIYLEEGANCYINNISFENCQAALGKVLYYEEGANFEISGTTNYTNCGEENDEHIYPPLIKKLTIYVDGEEFSSMLMEDMPADTTILTLDLPLSDDKCCGWFFDRELIEAVDYNKLLLEQKSTGNINLYTRTATPDMFNFIESGDGYAVKDKNTTGDVVVPRMYNNKLVIEIPHTSTSGSAGAFNGNNSSKGLTSITLPSSITSIGDRAFYNTKNLTNINIPNSVVSIGSEAFYYNTSLINLYIPDSVESIGNGAFRNCSALINVYLGSGLTGEIGTYTFSSCSSIIEIDIPYGITKINSYAFMSCTSLKRVSLPESITDLEYAFYGCSALEQITLPNSLVNLGTYAFRNCSSLVNFNIPRNVSTIGTGAIPTNLSSLTVDPNNSVFHGTALNNAIIETSTNKLIAITQNNPTIPTNVKEIGNSVFSQMRAITSLTIPDSVTTIGTQAFGWCQGLSTIYLPESVQTITASAYNYSPFYFCTGLIIYCGAPSKPSGWGTYWNQYDSSSKLTVKWGYTREQYEAETGDVSGLLAASVGIKNVENISSQFYPSAQPDQVGNNSFELLGEAKNLESHCGDQLNHIFVTIQADLDNGHYDATAVKAAILPDIKQREYVILVSDNNDSDTDDAA